MAIPAGFTTQLDAINEMLQSIGEAAVTSVDLTNVDVAAAAAALNRISLKVQTKGWSWNRDDNFTLTRDGGGLINLPADALSVANAYWADSDVGTPLRVVERARKLWNKDNNTFVFTSDVACDIIRLLTFDDMPEYARQAITQAAIEVFQVRLQGSAIVERVENIATSVCNALLEQREDEVDTQNVIGGNRFVSNMLYAGPLRRFR